MIIDISRGLCYTDQAVARKASQSEPKRRQANLENDTEKRKKASPANATRPGGDPREEREREERESQNSMSKTLERLNGPGLWRATAWAGEREKD